jgi:hypothetical protein
MKRTPKTKAKTEGAAAPKLAGGMGRWSIYSFRKKIVWLGHVEAATEAEALEKAYAAFKVPEHERFRITARRE